VLQVWSPHVLLIQLWVTVRILIFGFENCREKPSGPKSERLGETSFPFSYITLCPLAKKSSFFFLLAHARGLGTLISSEPDTESF
jgi:hypothetical protein